MKLLIAYVVLALGCHKSEKVEATTGSGSSSGAGHTTASAGSTATGSVGSAATGSSGVSVVGSGTATTAPTSSAPSQMSQLAKAVDDFDRWLAPIWRLPDKERFAILCRVAKDLVAKSDALRAMPNTATDWQATVDGLSGYIWAAQKCCVEQPKKLSPVMQAAQDDNNADCIKPLHDSFAEVVKLVPGAPAIDTHANDPVMKK